MQEQQEAPFTLVFVSVLLLQPIWVFQCKQAGNESFHQGVFG